MTAAWVELSVTHLERAITFYKCVFELIPTPIQTIAPDDTRRTCTLFRIVDGQQRGVVLIEDPSPPADDGVQVHIAINAALETYLQRVRCAGGTVLAALPASVPHACVPFTDTEGNRLAFIVPPPIPCETVDIA